MKNTKKISLLLLTCLLITIIPVSATSQNGNISNEVNINMNTVVDYYQINGVDYEELCDYIDNIVANEKTDPYANQPWEKYNPEDLTEEELNNVISRIANGEHVVLGEGIVGDNLQGFSSESSSNDSKWSAGGYNNTHQWITASALNILSIDGKTTICNWITTTDRTNLLTGSDWPDLYEDGNLLVDYNRKHFYYWPNKCDYMGNTSTENAKTRFVYWYNQAVIKYNSGSSSAIRAAAFENLGKAIHYLSDLYTPVHTAQCTFGNIANIATLAPMHSSFETKANQYKSNYYAGYDGGLYSGWLNYTNAYIADVVACASYNAYVSYCGNENTYGNAYGWALVSNQRDVAGLINKFYYDTH